MATFGIDVQVVVNRRYIATGDDLQEAVSKVQTVLDQGNYDDTDTTRWHSSGAEIVGYKVVSDDLEPDTEVS